MHKRDAMDRDRNLLGQETSPYLLQHAHNPVHWRSWSAAALAEAKRRDCPILLSIGYAACHWCHVMAHESFEDIETARLMNALFVNIKVDREERPDIDHIYMSALHALGQQGGWPLTMFLSPDGKPMLGGTYWPPESRWGRPSFRQVLQSVNSAWRTRRDEMESRGQTLADHLAKLSDLSAGPGVTPADLTRIGDALLSAVDPVHGGLRGAPKFPNAPIFRFFLNEMFRRGDPTFGEAYHVSWLPIYGPQMRSGTANCHVRISAVPMNSPLVSHPNVLIALNEPSLREFLPSVEPGGLALYNADRLPADCAGNGVRVTSIASTAIAVDSGRRRWAIW